VSATGVIDVGVPATGLPPEPVPAQVTVFFLDASDPSRLYAAGRTVAGGGDPVAAAVQALFDGPTARERPRMTTELPMTQVKVVLAGAGDTVAVRLPAAVPRLGDSALRQVACTAAAAMRPAAGALATTGGVRPGPWTRTVVTGGGWQRESTGAACPADAVPTAHPLGVPPGAPTPGDAAAQGASGGAGAGPAG
jgi:hypothetical protein